MLCRLMQGNDRGRPAEVGLIEEPGARTGAVMTILRLNMEYRFTFGDNQLLRIDTDPLFPRQLTENSISRLSGRPE